MHTFKRLCKRVAAAAVVFCLMTGMMPATETQAASEGTATLRIISTTDLHGQSVNVNYDSAFEYTGGSLAQVYTLMKSARSSLKYGATLTVDIGDTVYGYGSDSIYNGAVTGVEYMYAEMATMGYDAMVLGNHDFDYGYEYIKGALKDSGLKSKVVVSNVYSAKTKKSIWAQNKVITKTVTTTTGVKKKIRIGVFGVTCPTLTSHYDHSGILTTEDIVECARDQIAALQSKNVDIIVALAHSGIGSDDDDYMEMDEDAVYQLSKLDGIDAIMCGDDHVNYPSSDSGVQKYYDYDGVDENGLMNGKVVVSVADHAAGIGIADLKLKFKDGKVSIVSKTGKQKLVKESTEADASIVKINNKYQTQYEKLYKASLGKVATSINSYFAMLEDNAAIQAANESKIQYGLEYISQYAPEYANLPVIACTDYNGTSESQSIDIADDFTVGDSLNVQDWNRDCTSVYWITGAQLREWMEWRIGSAYQTPSTAQSATWSDASVRSWVTDSGMSPLTTNEWMKDMSSYHVFDGVEYTIDISQPARYSKSGSLINSSAHRISSLTCNGVDVTDGQKFIIVCSQITTKTPVISEVTEQKINRGNMSKGYNNELLQNYVKEQCAFGTFNVEADSNWSIQAPEATNYLLRAASKSETFAQSKSWYVRTLETNSTHHYYQISLGQTTEDTAGPLLVLGLENTKTTNHEVKIRAQASDSSKVTELLYFPGVLSVDSASWNGASSILPTGEFTASGNGTYSVRAKDAKGNYTVKYITVSNMNSSILEAPDVDKFTNRKRQLTGTTDPGLTVYVKASGLTYQTTSDSEGAFTCEVDLQKADSTVTVWVQDAAGRTSEKVYVTVARTGANLPLISNITNKQRGITGKINDSIYCKVIAIVGKTVYVPKNGGSDSYLNCAAFNDSYTIVETDFTISDGYFTLAVPVLNAGTAVRVYSLDWMDRISVLTDFETENVAPNMPVVKELYLMDDYVYGRIPEIGTDQCTVTVSDGTNTYTGTADDMGYFQVKIGKVTDSTKLTVTASDVVNGKTRTSAKETLAVSSYESLLSSYTDISFDEIDSKSTQISGHIDDYQGQINLLVGKTRILVKTDENGDFTYTMSKPRAANTSVVAMVRSTDGTVMDIAATAVKLALPDDPELLTETIMDTTTEIKVACADKATAVVKIGSKYYKAKTGVYDKKTKKYVYTITLKKAPKENQKVIVYMMNDAGKSGKLRTVVEADPDKPVEDEAETGTEA